MRPQKFFFLFLWYLKFNLLLQAFSIFSFIIFSSFSLFLCPPNSFTSSLNSIAILTLRSNQFSLNSCWYGPDCVLPRNSCQLKLFSVPTTFQVIRVGNLNFRSHHSKCDSCWLFLFRSNRRRALRVGFQTVLSSDPQKIFGSGRLDQL